MDYAKKQVLRGGVEASIDYFFSEPKESKNFLRVTYLAIYHHDGCVIRGGWAHYCLYYFLSLCSLTIC